MTHNERYWNTMTWVRSFSILGLIIQEIASHTPVDTFKKNTLRLMQRKSFPTGAHWTFSKVSCTLREYVVHLQGAHV